MPTVNLGHLRKHPFDVARMIDLRIERTREMSCYVELASTSRPSTLRPETQHVHEKDIYDERFPTHMDSLEDRSSRRDRPGIWPDRSPDRRRDHHGCRHAWHQH